VSEIHITREHSLGLAQARKLAFRWAETAEAKLDMECVYEEGKADDLVRFERPGASGTLKVTKDRFELNAKLGLLLGVFKGRIESEIVKNLDALLAEKEPLKAFEKGLAKHEAKHVAKAPAKKAAPKAAAKRKA
jgi:putative polyhydroxyalkanoate system protein